MRTAVLIGLALAWAGSAAADDTVHYSLTPVLAKGKLEALAFDVRFKGEADGETVLNLPNEWGGFTELYQGVRDLRIDGKGVAVSSPDAARRVVRHEPGTELRVSYRIVQYWPGVPKVTGGNEYRPILQPGYFHAIGDTVFIAPEGDGSRPASFAVKGLPRGWAFASDLEHATSGRKLVLGDIIESVSVGGDFRVVKRGPVRVAIRGKWSFTDDTFMGQLGPIFESHRRFWGDAEEPYLVTVIQLASDPGQRSIGGTGRSDAFAFFATDNADSVGLSYTLAHEHMHTWIPRRIGGMPGDEEPRDYWLSEGFTDFYTMRLLVRDAVWTVEQFVSQLNDHLADYGNSPVRTAPNAHIVENFWKDPESGKLPYRRGQLLATKWDLDVRKATNGARDLDDVVLAMKARARAASDKPPVASVLFREEMQRLGVDVSADLERLMEKGEAVLLPADVFAPCGTMATLDLAEFDRGFDPVKTGQNGNKVTGLREDSPGYRAGLRDGMQILKREAGKPGDSRVDLTYRVLDNGVERVVTYKPEGSKRITLQEFTLRAGMTEAERKACAARLGGV